MRYLPHVVHTHLVRCKSARLKPFRLGVIHDTQGANIPGIKDLVGLGNYFDSTFNTPRASSIPVGVDAEGNSARYVIDREKAWHVAFYNPWALGIENIGFASQTSWPEAQLVENARWIAYWNFHRGIPIAKGAVTPSGLITVPGWLRHAELGALGGGHQDPGEHYPLHEVLDLARGFRHHYTSHIHLDRDAQE